MKFLNIQRISFSVTKLNVTKVGNRVQQTMVLANPNGRQKWFPAHFQSIFIGFHAILNEIPEHPKSKFLGYETQCYEGRDSGSANHSFSQSKWTPKVISRIIPVQFHWFYKRFPVANSGNRKCYLVTMKITISGGQQTLKSQEIGPPAPPWVVHVA